MARQNSDEKKIADWRKSLIGGACACLVVFIMTLTIVIWSPKHRKNNREQDDILSEKPFLEDLYLETKTSSIWHRCDLLPAGYEWMCPGSTCRRTCRALLPEVKRRPDDWRPFKHRVKYCLSQPMKETCRLNFNRSIAITILVMNAIKLTILIHVVRHPPEEPLFVVGDAIQSFLISPDKASEKAGWVSGRAVRERENWNSPCVNDGKRRRWGAAASKRRWKFSIAMYAIALVFAISILIWGILAIPGPRDIISLWNLGFGAVNEVTVITGLEDQNRSDLTSVILLSNLPQVGFSLLYFQYNGLFTSMASAKEWSDFGYMRKPLRVSSIPRGEQRSRYFLQLPYKFSIPLLLVSILVHWLLSQSIFIVAVESHGHFWYQDVEDSMRWEVISCGYSPIAIIFVIITAASMGVAVASIASLRLPTFMPLVGSCSLAIAAACHHPENMPRDGAELKPLQWGAMVYDTERKVSRHCGFSEKPVEEPEIGVMYC
ncbi:hypothetical protein LB507_004337 [Fusarium sp. FIESC RH6]|nr:hypothetical protein LB507_004337 [Fusarium sp. FIESC RH6]